MAEKSKPPTPRVVGDSDWIGEFERPEEMKERRKYVRFQTHGDLCVENRSFTGTAIRRCGLQYNSLQKRQQTDLERLLEFLRQHF